MFAPIITEGPFTPTLESDFSSWAPVEGDDQVTEFPGWIEDANPSDSYNASN